MTIWYCSTPSRRLKDMSRRSARKRLTHLESKAFNKRPHQYLILNKLESMSIHVTVISIYHVTVISTDGTGWYFAAVAVSRSLRTPVQSACIYSVAHQDHESASVMKYTNTSIMGMLPLTPAGRRMRRVQSAGS